MMAIVQLEGKVKPECEAHKCETQSLPCGENPITTSEALQRVANLVRGSAGEITQKLIEAAKQGQLPHAKYLFEVAGIHPTRPEVTAAKPEESVIYSWLKELGVEGGIQDKEAMREAGPGERIL
ncbi:MAG: hypothetical protein WA252_03085 [Candidatus Sulfotelmatobacter sp.]|jgi:hypothetical protein